MKKTGKKALNSILAAALVMMSLTGCGSSTADSSVSDAADSTVEADTDSTVEVEADTESAEAAEDEEATETFESVTISVFAAKSLNTVMEELIAEYNRTQPNVTVIGNYDSSGTLQTQIEEGAACDVFFFCGAVTDEYIGGRGPSRRGNQI